MESVSYLVVCLASLGGFAALRYCLPRVRRPYWLLGSTWAGIVLMLGFIASVPSLVDSACLLAVGLLVLLLVAISRCNLAIIVRERQDRSVLRSKYHAIQQVVAAVDEVVWELDLSGPGFTFISAQIEPLLGFPVSVWLGNYSFWVSRLHPDDGWVADHLHMLHDQPGRYNFAYRMRSRDGRYIWIRESGLVPSAPGGQQRRILRGSIRDISAEKAAQTRMDAAHELELENSRKTGMAEVATGVLHNVGNVLNSVNVSGDLIVDRIRHSRVVDLLRISDLIQEHRECLADFVSSDPRGQIVPDLLRAISEQLVAENREISLETTRISERINHIKEIVAVQQSHARHHGVHEPHDLVKLADDALKLIEHLVSRTRVEISFEYSPGLPMVLVDGHRVLQILVNLIRNAAESIEVAAPVRPRILLQAGPAPGGLTVRLKVVDNGVGVAVEHRDSLFRHGFTTKRKGHGFGLHSGAVAAAEMGGRLWMESDGRDCGATFVLELPALACETTPWQNPGEDVAA